MSYRLELLDYISSTVSDYRAGEITSPNPEQIERWVNQFSSEVQIPILKEMSFTLHQTYYSRDYINRYFSSLVTNEQLIGEVVPKDYWKKTNVLKIQQHGNSQSDILSLFGEALLEKCHWNVESCRNCEGDIIYLDDALFSGSRVRVDLTEWIKTMAPSRGKVHIIVIVSHQFGEWQTREYLEREAEKHKKELEFVFWAATRYENRKSYRNKSEVLWPTKSVLAFPEVLQYVQLDKKFPFEPRESGEKLENQIFSSDEGRKLLEREFLLAGLRIRSFCKEPKAVLRPLGFGPFGLGFGSLIVTYRNCPNNCPLALWWGDPNAHEGHPFKKWYPLFPRKVYNQDERKNEGYGVTF